MVFSEVYWTGFYTACFALVIGIISVCYKSKCKRIKMCGIEIDRDVEIELKEDLRRSPSIDNPI